MSFADQLTVARIAATSFVLVLFVWHFPNHDYYATVLFALAMTTDWFDGRVARSSGNSSALGSLLDPIADKVLVLSTLIVLGGLQDGGAWSIDIALWAGVVTLVLTWLSGLDYARVAPQILRGDKSLS